MKTSTVARGSIRAVHRLQSREPEGLTDPEKCAAVYTALGQCAARTAAGIARVSQALPPLTAAQERLVDERLQTILEALTPAQLNWVIDCYLDAFKSELLSHDLTPAERDAAYALWGDELEMWMIEHPGGSGR